MSDLGPPKRRRHPTFSVTQLRAFSTVAETRSYVEAADRLGYTEPGVHHQVKRLEAALGCLLLERTGRTVRLTADGERLLPQCITILRETELLVSLAEHRRPANSLRIAAGRLTSAYILPDVLAHLRHRDPSLEVDLIGGDRVDVLERVRAGEADLGLSDSLDEIVDPTEFTISRWRKTEFNLFESPAGPRGNKMTIYSLRMSTALSSVVASLSQTREIHVSLVPSADAVKQMCMAGMGAGFLRRDSVQLEVRAGLLRPNRLFPDPVAVSVWAIQSRRHHTPESVATFLRLTSAYHHSAFGLPVALP